MTNKSYIMGGKHDHERYTTPDIVLTVDDIDLANCQSLYVTIKQEARPNDIYINREKDTCTINGTTR